MALIRDIAKIDAEYDKDKYAKALAYYLAHHEVSILDVMGSEYAECGITKNEAIMRQKINDDALISTFINLLGFLGDPDFVVELGCGYGYNLFQLKKSFPGRLYLGGEYSQNAVKLGRLFGNDIDPFNFYDETWPIIERIPDSAIIFTRHAIEQLPRAAPFISTLSKYKRKIDKIVHLEPIYELHPNTGLGESRQEYTIKNDYNTDLLTEIKRIGGRIKYSEYDVVAENPLNPTSILVWEF